MVYYGLTNAIGAVLGAPLGSTAATDAQQTYSEQVYSYFQIVYLLATNPFFVQYDLIRLEIDDVVVYDAETGSTSQVGFRFYDGRQTLPDPVVTKYVAENPGANYGDILLVLPKAEYESPPKVRAVISMATEASGSSSVFINTVDPHVYTSDYTRAAYDRQLGIVWQYFPASAYFSSLDATLNGFGVDSSTEIARVRWQTDCSDPFNFVSLDGTSCVLFNGYSDTDGVFAMFLVDTRTGREVTRTGHAGDMASISASPILAMDGSVVDPNKYVVFGSYDSVWSASANSYVAVVDLTESTIQIVDLTVAIDQESKACMGRRRPDSVSFFCAYWEQGDSEDAAHRVVEVVWYGSDDVGANDVWIGASGEIVNAVQYDPQTGYLCVATTLSAQSRIRVINPKTGVEVNTLEQSRTYMQEISPLGASMRVFSKPGHVLFAGASDNAMYDLDLSTMTVSEWAAGTGSNPFRGIFDQNRGVWLYQNSLEDPDVPASFMQGWQRVSTVTVSPRSMTLREAIVLVCSLAGLTEDDLTFEGFTDDMTLVGYTIAGDSTTRSILGSLADFYDFSFVETGTGYFFKKVNKNGGIVVDGSVEPEQLVQRDSGGSVVVQDRADLQTPTKLDFTYVSKDGGWDAGHVSANRPRAYFDVTSSLRALELNAPIVNYDATMQELVVQRLHQIVTSGRNFSFEVVPDYAHFLPGDTLDLQVDDQVYMVQITQHGFGDDGTVSIEAFNISSDVGVSVSTVTNTPNQVVVPPNVYSVQYVRLDIPLLAPTDDAGGAALVEYHTVAPALGSSWSGANLYLGRNPAALTRAYWQTSVGLVATSLNALAAPPAAFMRDDESSVRLSVHAGASSQLVSASEADVIWGANLAFVGQPGRWEGVGFESAIVNEDGTVEISKFTFRGWQGTEVYADQHELGDYFVLVSRDWVRRLTEATDQLGELEYFKAVLSSTTGIGTPVGHYTHDGAAETPFAPVNIDAVVSGSDVDVSWDGRSRIDPWGMFDVSAPSGESSTSYEVDVMDGDTVKRTLPATTNSVTYADADIVTDWGSMPSELTLRVYQISALVGRGHRAERTVQL